MQLVSKQPVRNVERALVTFRSPCVRPRQHPGLEIVCGPEIGDGLVVHGSIEVIAIAEVENQPTPVGDPADHALTSVLIEPRKVRAICRGLIIKEPRNSREGLSSGIQRPAVNHVAADRNVQFEKWANARNVDTKVTISNGTARLVVALIQGSS